MLSIHKYPPTAFKNCTYAHERGRYLPPVNPPMNWWKLLAQTKATKLLKNTSSRRLKMFQKALITFFAIAISQNYSLASSPYNLPQVSAPRELVEADSEFREGTVTKLTAKDVERFIPWAQNAENILTKALEDSNNMGLPDRVTYLQQKIQSVVRSSGTKSYQTLMRFSLNRGLLLIKELLNETVPTQPGVYENAVDIMDNTIKIALKFYQSDLTFQNSIQDGAQTVVYSQADFGINFFNAVYKSVISVADASAQFRLLYKAYEMLNWDLARDENALEYSEEIERIFYVINPMDEHSSQDDTFNIKRVRELNRLNDLELKTKLASINNRS